MLRQNSTLCLFGFVVRWQTANDNAPYRLFRHNIYSANRLSLPLKAGEKVAKVTESIISKIELLKKIEG
jgi:hypothetical protein